MNLYAMGWRPFRVSWERLVIGPPGMRVVVSTSHPSFGTYYSASAQEYDHPGDTRNDRMGLIEKMCVESLEKTAKEATCRSAIVCIMHAKMKGELVRDERYFPGMIGEPRAGLFA